MNGAEALVRTLADNGVTACFANPGTSEMHLVAALGREPRVRSVLGLFEGVCTGAADGFARRARAAVGTDAGAPIGVPKSGGGRDGWSSTGLRDGWGGRGHGGGGGVAVIG